MCYETKIEYNLLKDQIQDHLTGLLIYPISTLPRLSQSIKQIHLFVKVPMYPVVVFLPIDTHW